jgi:hypothetical protein
MHTSKRLLTALKINKEAQGIFDEERSSKVKYMFHHH